MRFPALFIGHGSPMNAIVESKTTETWSALAAQLPKPDAILVISAHWEESSLKVLAMDKPEQIYDMYGFPNELYQVKYPAPGSPKLAQKVSELLGDFGVEKIQQGWGFDHGSWSVLRHMYPKADVPVVQLSLDRRQNEAWHFQVGKKLAPLRDENILILASGSIVHNLAERGGSTRPSSTEWNDFVNSNVGARLEASKHPLVNYKKHPLAGKAAPDQEHYQPLLYLLGLLDANKEDQLETYLKDSFDLPAVGMMSYKLSQVEKEL